MMFAKETDIEQIREVAKGLLWLDPNDMLVPSVGMTMHPYFDFPVTAYKDENGELKMVQIFGIEENRQEEYRHNLENVCNYISGTIDKSNLTEIFMKVRQPYHFALLKFSMPYMTKEDFDKWLGDTWVSSENPNQDANVSISEFIEWFSEADKTTMMNDDELEYYNKLPDIVEVYRGVAVGRAESEGLSWTCNFETAEWFANRFNTEEQLGYIIKGKIKKENVFAYFNRRNEDEILCNSDEIYDVERVHTAPKKKNHSQVISK